MRRSIADRISQKISPVIRKLQDVNIGLLGSKTQLLRITTTETSIMGDITQQVNAEIIDNCIIKRPFANAVELFDKQNSETNNNETIALNMYDILPIEIRIPFQSNSTNTENLEVEIKKGDILVEVLIDPNGNKIPFIMKVTRLKGNFFVKQMTGKVYEAALLRGTIETGIQLKIDSYIESYVDVE